MLQWIGVVSSALGSSKLVEVVLIIYDLAISLILLIIRLEFERSISCISKSAIRHFDLIIHNLRTSDSIKTFFEMNSMLSTIVTFIGSIIK